MVGAGGRRRWPRAGGVGFRTGPAMCRTPSTLIPVSRASLARSASAAVSASYRESFAGAETARAIRPIAGQPCLVHRCRTHGASHHQLPELRDSSLLRVLVLTHNGRSRPVFRGRLRVSRLGFRSRPRRVPGPARTRTSRGDEFVPHRETARYLSKRYKYYELSIRRYGRRRELRSQSSMKAERESMFSWGRAVYKDLSSNSD